ALVDYGAGNLRSVEKAFLAIGAEVKRTNQPDEVQRADKIILPGVGAFGDGMANLRQSGMQEVILERVSQGIPLIGICLGMQMLFESSEEHGYHEGLGLLRGHVREFPRSGLRVPQTGWNRLKQARPTRLLIGLPEEPYVYFNHSYYCDAHPEETLALTEYGFNYPSVVGNDQICGVQFHPEKSQDLGLQILRNFVEVW
ncbi:MAG: imidazole glycerol phosphate synthase subunit HisH, partial [Anaerolineales bacterium]